MWMGLVQSVEGLTSSTRLTVSQVSQVSPAWLPVNWDGGFSSSFELELKHQLSLTQVEGSLCLQSKPAPYSKSL